MKKTITELIQVDSSLAIPVYKQIVQSIYRSIENGILKKDDILPSVNKISEVFSLARGSVFTAYNDLRAAGVIDSIPGRGYFVSSTETRQTKRIFLLFSTFNPYKEKLFRSLLDNLPENYQVDIYFHHHNIQVFESLVRDQAGYHNIFVIMPEINKDTMSILSRLDTKKVYLLDVGFKEYKNDFPGVFQNFEKDIYAVLSGLHHLVSKYQRCYVVAPDSIEAKAIITGFNKFYRKTGLTTGVKDKPGEIKKGDAFIVVEDEHLVEIVQLARAKNWVLGEDIGVISYHENALKSVIGQGITTITSDLDAMGKSMANLIVNSSQQVIENPYVLIDRKSF